MTRILLTRPWDRNYQLAVFLGDEVLARTGRSAAGVLLLDLDDELFRWFKSQASFAGWSIHWRGRFFHVLRREINKLNRGNFLSGFPGLHHFVELERRWI